MRYVGSNVRLIPGNDVLVMGVPSGIRRVAKKESQNFQVRPRLGCGVTIVYNISGRDNGGVKELSVVAYEHAPFINAGWDQKKKRITSEVQRIVTTARAQRGNAPRL